MPGAPPVTLRGTAGPRSLAHRARQHLSKPGAQGVLTTYSAFLSHLTRGPGEALDGMMQQFTSEVQVGLRGGTEPVPNTGCSQ